MYLVIKSLPLKKEDRMEERLEGVLEKACH
jgi:hypothetical protein